MAQSKNKKMLKKAMSKKELSPSEKAKKCAPRNEIVRAMVERGLFQSATHKDKKRASKNHLNKHKSLNLGY